MVMIYIRLSKKRPTLIIFGMGLRMYFENKRTVHCSKG